MLYHKNVIINLLRKINNFSVLIENTYYGVLLLKLLKIIIIQYSFKVEAVNRMVYYC